MREQVEERIKAILASKLEVSEDTLKSIGPDTALLGKGVGLDSMETLTLVTEIEEAFEIEILDRELSEELFRSLQVLADFVRERLPVKES